MNFDKSKKYKMPSGLGGIFELKFVNEANGVFTFKIITKGWERVVSFTSETIFKVEPTA